MQAKWINDSEDMIKAWSRKIERMVSSFADQPGAVTPDAYATSGLLEDNIRMLDKLERSRRAHEMVCMDWAAAEFADQVPLKFHNVVLSKLALVSPT